MFEKFFPKEFNFFDFLDKEAGIALQAAELFKELVEKGTIDDISREKMRDIEHEGDKMAYAIIDHLNKTFITPFDREDIHMLAKKLDDVNDMINTIVSRMKVYKITKVNQILIEFGALIYRSVEELCCAVRGLRDMKHAESTLKSCMDIGKMESEGDVLRDRALSELFDKEKNPIEIIKWKEIYQHAETVLDICKVVAHVVESIMVKQA
jgi:predicted phosphate transport protein (TIGR00153 family)